MINKIKSLAIIALITIFPTFLVWLPFFLRLNNFWGIPLPQNGMATIVANYDGPLYIVVAKTLYQSSALSEFALNLPDKYYAAHFPLFPLLIRLVSPIFGFPYAMLFLTIFGSFLTLYYFSKLVADFVEKKDIYWITFVFSLLPARFLIVRSVGSAEPLFMAFIIASSHYFKKEKYLLSAIFGGLAVATKPPGVLLFLAYLIYIIAIRFKKAALSNLNSVIKIKEILKFTPLLLMPLSLFAVFLFYKFSFNNFFAYFDSGDNIHLFFPPFQIFNYSQPWVGTFWLEEIIFVYLFCAFALTKLFKLRSSFYAVFFSIFFLSLIFVSHRDLIRYALPISPFVYVAFSDIIVKKEFKITFLVIIIPIFLYSLSYISQNVMPISNWAPFL